MKKIEFNINLHCKQCIQKIKPLLDIANNIQDWKVNLEKKTLRIQGNNITVNTINTLLASSGYYVTDGKNSFWIDGKQWRKAFFNTLNCLIGCSIGDFGMVIFLQAYYPNTDWYVQMLLAILAGLFTSILLETYLLKIREKFKWLPALKIALGMSFLSMTAMEIVMTGTDFMITSGKAAFDSFRYWLAILPALVLGFLVPLPYNYYKLKKFNLSCHG